MNPEKKKEIFEFIRHQITNAESRVSGYVFDASNQLLFVDEIVNFLGVNLHDVISVYEEILEDSFESLNLFSRF